MKKLCRLLILFYFIVGKETYSQTQRSIFKNYLMPELPQNRYGEIHISRDGSVLVSATEFSFAMISGSILSPFSIGLSKEYKIKNIKNNFFGDPMKNIAESSEGNIFFTNANNQITYFKNTETGDCDLPPFYFPIKGDTPGVILSLWFDIEDNLYIGSTGGAFYKVPNAGTNKSLDPKKYEIASSTDSNMVISKGELRVEKVPVDHSGGIFCFAQNRISKEIIWLGTGNGLYKYNSSTGEVSEVYKPETKTTVTDIEVLANGDIWFSTFETGMGVYRPQHQKCFFYPYPKNKSSFKALFPIRSFYIKSPSEFYVAIMDSLPAIFDITTGVYRFIRDPFNHPQFALWRNSTSDIKQDSAGNFYFINAGFLYSANLSDNPEWIGKSSTNTEYTPLIYQAKDINNRLIADYYTRPELLKTLKLNSKQNSFAVYYTSNYYSPHKRTQFAWKLEGSDVGYWYEMPVVSNDNDSLHIAEFENLKPGKYRLRVKMRFENEEWMTNEAKMVIIITPPYWATWWFWVALAAVISLLAYIIIRIRIRDIRKKEQLKSRYEKELLELEAKALRAQMNPHFIFNCMNSIKSLMQEKEIDKGITYLTTFSKLIRTLFNNANKKEISLYDEIETCKFYLQLEAMRFDSKFA